MKLNVLRANELIETVDFSSEVSGVENSEVTFYIGRSEENHVHLNDKQISREHLALIYSQGHWKLKKLSTFGSFFVNGVPGEEFTLDGGEVINLGPYQMTVEGIKPSPTFSEAMEEAKVASSSLESDYDADESTSFQMSETETIALSSDDTSSKSDEPHEDELQASSDEVGESQEGEEQSFGQNDETELDSENVNYEMDGEENFDQFGSADGDSFSDNLPDDPDRTQVIQTFAQFYLDIFGENAPYDRFSLEDQETFIGRDPQKCQIVLDDPEVSTVHAVLRKNNIICTLEDLSSENGTLLNGQRINKSALTNEDEFIIGSTTFTVKVVSDLIKEEENRLMPVEENQVVEVEEIVEVDPDDDQFDDEVGMEEEPKSLVGKFKKAWRDPEKRKRILIYLVVLVGVYTFLGPDPAPVKKKGAKQSKDNRRLKEKVDEATAIALKPKRKLTAEELALVETKYELSKTLFRQGKLNQALVEINTVFNYVDQYKNAAQVKANITQALELLEKKEEERRKKEQEAITKEKIKTLIDKANKAVADKKMDLAESYVTEITALDPDNFEINQIKLEIEAFRREQDRLSVEQAQKEAERKRQLTLLEPGKTAFLKKDWYVSINELEKFLKTKSLDEDLTKEGTDMLNQAKTNLDNIVNPLVGKARSLIEGQDLKGAYETYKEVLQYDPFHSESLNKMDEIKTTLHLRSRKTYREAIIAESLSLFQEAKEKFQEVQQISPTDGEYYIKATEKLRNYLD